MRVLLFTGKGGVGKTTVAAATAVHAARSGARTLLLSLDAGHSLADVVAVPVGGAASQVEVGLSVQQVDPAAGRSWRGVAEHLLGVAADVGVDPPVTEDLAAFPGAQDLLALLAIRDQARRGSWDLVVVDGQATAEALRMLALPEAAGRWLRRMLPVEQRIRRALEISVRPPFRGADEPPRQDHLVAVADRLQAELVAAREVLTSPSASARLVLTPESLVLADARRAWSALALHGYLVDGVVANRVLPDAATDPWPADRVRRQAVLLAEIDAGFPGLTVQRVAMAAAEPSGLGALARLGTVLYGPVGGKARARLLAEPRIRPPMQVQRDGEQFVLQLDLPRVSRQDVDLSRHGDELLVGVGRQCRSLSLPSALRRCRVVGASLREGRLQVRFEPDPALWRSS